MEATSSGINNMQSWVNYSQIFHNFAVGMAALLAGAGGLKILYEIAANFKEQRRRLRQEKELKVLYPPIKLDKTFELISSSKNPDWIYLHDFLSDKKHHIASNLTFIDLGYTRDSVKQMSHDVFSRIKEGEKFLTKGEFGT